MGTGAYRALRRAMSSDSGSSSSGSGHDSHGGSGRRSPAPWQVSEEDWKKLPQEQRDALQEKRDTFLAEQKIKNDPLGAAKELLSDAMNPDTAAGSTPQDRIRVADETIDDYQSLSKLIGHAMFKDQIPGETIAAGSVGSNAKSMLVEINRPAVFAALGTTQEEYFSKLEGAYLDSAEAHLARATEMPAGKTAQESYEIRIEHYRSATHAVEMAGHVRSVSENEKYHVNSVNRESDVLGSRGISKEYLEETRNDIIRDRDTQLRQQANLEGQREDAQFGYLSPEARGVPRFEP